MKVISNNILNRYGKKWPFFFLFFSLLKVHSQEIAKVSELVDSIKIYYNSQDHSALYRLLSEDFKSKIKESDLTEFYKNNLYQNYGKIISYRYHKNEQGAETYQMRMNKGQLKLVLYIESHLRIAGMQWLPMNDQGEAQQKRRSDYLSDNAKASPLDLKVDSAVKDHMSSVVSCGLSLGIYKNGKEYYYNYGETKRETMKATTKNSIYEIGSITKTFTGILLAKAVSENKIGLNDDIRLWLPGNYPDLEYKGKAILVKHLADHTSRIPSVPLDIEKQKNYDPLNPYKNYNRQMMFEALKNFRPDTLPGSKYDYSNMGMSLLGIILEKVYAKNYHELIRDYTEPHQLTHTRVTLSTDDLNLLCVGYNDAGKETPYWDLNEFIAAGGIHSSTEDMIKYLKLNLEEKEIPIKESHQIQWGDEKFGIGLGWHIIQTKKGNKMIWHNGGTYGFSSFCGFIREKDCALIILSNSGSNVDAIGISLFKFLQE